MSAARALAAGLAAGIGCILAGCEAAPVSMPPFGVSDDYQVLPGRPGPGLVADPESPIPDLPKPIGFRPLPNLCSSSFDGQTRTVHHVYQGVAGTAETLAFLRQQAAYHGWQPTGFASTNGAAATLAYTKGREDLTLRVNEGTAITSITVDITAKGVPPRPAAGR